MKLLGLILWSTVSWAAAPVLFFSDLQSGPKTGGENNNGVYVTLYGNNLGSTPTAKVGGGDVIVKSNPTTWLWYQKMVIQLGASAATGNIVVTNGGQNSNGLPFTVRTGNIYFVTTGGSDSANGAFATPWATIAHAAHNMAAGDITYVRQGVSQTGDDGFGSPLNIAGMNGTSSAPYALVVYPGETASIGGQTNSRGIIQYSTGSNYWIVAGFSIPCGTNSESLNIYDGSLNWRVIGNKITCPTGDAQTGALTSGGQNSTGASPNNATILGNEVYSVGASTAAKTYHAAYFGHYGDLSGYEVGWNSVHDIQGCRGIMFHPCDSSSGLPECATAAAYNITIHDNLVYNVRCDGIALANSDPDLGTISVYNNVVYHVGTGPDPGGQPSTYSCLYGGNSNGTVTTPIQAVNNTFYDCSSRGAGDYGAITPYIPMMFQNNIVQQTGQPYKVSGANAALTGSQNIWYGGSGVPSGPTGSITSNPSFVSTSTPDFHLSSAGSPANAAGTASGAPTQDFVGLTRPSPPSIGAYEYAAAAPAIGGSATSGKITVSGKASVH